MNCVKCGAQLGENDAFCPNCGTPVQKVGGVNNIDKGTSNNNINNGNMNYNYERPVNQQASTQNYSQPINQQNYSHQPVNQQTNPQNYSTSNINQQYGGNKKSGGSPIKTCIIIIIVVAILAAIGFVIYSIVSPSNKKENTSTSLQNTLSSSNTNTSSVSQVSDSTYKVNYAGFKLYIPDNLVYEFDNINNAISIGDSSSTWVAQLYIQEAQFQQVKQQKDNLKKSFEDYCSAEVSNVTIETIDGIEFMIFEADMAGTHELVVFAKLNSMYITCIEIANENNDYDRDVLEELTPILKTAEYDGDSKSLETNDAIDANKISEAIQDVVGGTEEGETQETDETTEELNTTDETTEQINENQISE